MFKSALKSISYHWRQAILIACGGALACAVLSGALMMGTSVRQTLKTISQERLGTIEWTIGGGNRLFAASIADRFDLAMVPLVRVQGTVLVNRITGDPLEIPMVQVIGVDETFFTFAPAAVSSLEAGHVFINESLATRLGAELPENISIRVPVFTAIPREAPLASAGEKSTRRWRGKVADVLRADQLGNFNLAAEQRPLPTVFVRLDRLQVLTNARGRANLFAGKTPKGGREAVVARLEEVVRPEDYGLRLEKVDSLSRLLVTSDRVFLDQTVGDVLARLPEARRSLTYLVNSIETDRGETKKKTPYSFVEAVSQPAQGISINSWLADTLGVHEGDAITTSFFVLNATGGFDEQAVRLTVDEVAPVEAWLADSPLGPRFPGLTDVERCAGWNIGLPMDEQALNDPENEQYWQTYRATPKLRVPFDLGRRLWGSRYGDTTGVDFPLTDTIEGTVRRQLQDRVPPASVGLFVRDVQADAKSAVDQSMDFGQLFGGMSFFVVIAALLLTGLQTALGVEKRLEEAGVLKAVGFTTGAVRCQLLIELFVTLIPGVLFGACLAPVYANCLIWGLNGRWGGAVADAPLVFACSRADFFIGFLLVFSLGMLVGGGIVWKRCSSLPVVLLRGDTDVPGACHAGTGRLAREVNGRRKWPEILGVLCWVCAGGVALGAALVIPDALSGPFFAVGALTLTGASLLLYGWLEQKEGSRHRTQTRLGLVVGGLSRRATRTTLAVILTASGCFMVFAVAGMTRDISQKAHERNSGTGGFEFFAESAVPVLPERTAGNPQGVVFPEWYPDAPSSIVPLRVRNGADASCLNLNASPEPEIYGVDPRLMIKKSAFVKAGREGSEWDKLLRPDRSGQAADRNWIPALAGDIDTAVWGLRLKADPVKGDILRYPRGDGSWVNVKLVGRLPHRLTVFQGSLLIDVEDFVENFPAEEGYRAFLFDLPAGKPGITTQVLREEYGTLGLDIETTAQRLRAFYRVEATFLNMFLALGGLGVALGTLGLAIVVSRNLLERRAEFAMMRAVGFSRRSVQLVVLSEAVMMLVLGLLIGTGSSLLAVLPGITSGATRPPLGMMTVVLAGLVINGLFWVWLGGRGVTRMPMLAALRSE